jgi:hypothetical protein
MFAQCGSTRDGKETNIGKAKIAVAGAAGRVRRHIVKTGRRYRAIEIQAGRQQTMIAADPSPTISAKPRSHDLQQSKCALV